MKKITPIVGVALALILTLTGCVSNDAPAKETAKPKKTTSATPTPTPKGSEKGAEKAADEGKATATEDGIIVTFAAQGEKGADDKYATFPVDLAVSVPSIAKLSDTEYAEILEVADPEQKNTFAAFDFYKVVVKEVYVSGDNPEFQGSYTSYNVVDAEGVKLNDLPLIGFDWCKTNSFLPEFVTGAPNESCLIGAVAKGTEAPAGVQFAQFETKYDPLKGSPVAILKK